MKKTLIALLACAAVMPAMAANWNITGIKASTNGSQTLKADYMYYVIYSGANSADALTTTLSNMTFDDFTTSSEFTFSAVNGTAANNIAKTGIVSWMASVAKPIDSDLDTMVFGADNIYGVSVYQGNSFSVAAAVRMPSTNNISFDSVDTSYTDFASATTPEPATATLSLLALAGLASRRRRH